MKSKQCVKSEFLTKKVMEQKNTVVEDNAMDVFMDGPFMQWVSKIFSLKTPDFKPLNFSAPWISRSSKTLVLARPDQWRLSPQHLAKFVSR